MKELSNAKLLELLESACFVFAHNPTKKNGKDLERLENELAKRLDISKEELDEIRSRS